MSSAQAASKVSVVAAKLSPNSKTPSPVVVLVGNSACTELLLITRELEREDDDRKHDDNEGEKR